MTPVQKTTKGDTTAGARIRQARHSAKLTSANMAKTIHISRGYLSELENDKAEASDKVLRAMQVELGINPEFVRTGAGPVFEDVKKFTPRGKQVAEYVDGDAFGGALDVAERPAHYAGAGPPSQARGAPATLDRGRRVSDSESLRLVIEVVLKQLDHLGLKLAPAKAAELIVLIYEHLASDEIEEEQVKQTASRYLRLVG